MLYDYPPCPKCGGDQLPQSLFIRNPYCPMCYLQEGRDLRARILQQLKELPLAEQIEKLSAYVVTHASIQDLNEMEEEFSK